MLKRQLLNYLKILSHSKIQLFPTEKILNHKYNKYSNSLIRVIWLTVSGDKATLPKKPGHLPETEREAQN